MDLDGSTKTVSVLIVDDQLPFRAVARTVIGMTAGFDAARTIGRITLRASDLVPRGAPARFLRG